MWDIKYRPTIFSDVLGQETTKTVLTSRIKSKSFSDTSYALAGLHGSGKTTLARIFAKSMLCGNPTTSGDPCLTCESCKSFSREQNMDFEEVDAAGHGTIEWVRSKVDNLQGNLYSSNKKIFLIDEAHRMSRDAQDCLLKPIEDKKIVCIFCTTEPQKMRPAIRSRCEVFSIEKVLESDIQKRLELICQTEQVEFEPEALAWIVSYGKGHIRDCINAIEQVSKVGSITRDNVKMYLGVGWSTEVLTLIDHILSDNSPEALRLVESLAYRISPQDIYAQIIENIVWLIYQAKNISVPSSFDANVGFQINQKYNSILINMLMIRVNRAFYSYDIPSLICEVALLIEKVHRGLDTAQTQTITPIQSVKREQPRQISHSLTPMDSLAMNPSIKPIMDANSSISTPKNWNTSHSNIEMTPNDFKSKFNSI